MSVWNYVVTAHKPTNVTHSCVGNFTGPQELNLIIAYVLHFSFYSFSLCVNVLGFSLLAILMPRKMLGFSHSSSAYFTPYGLFQVLIVVFFSLACIIFLDRLLRFCKRIINFWFFMWFLIRVY